MFKKKNFFLEEATLFFLNIKKLIFTITDIYFSGEEKMQSLHSQNAVSDYGSAIGSNGDTVDTSDYSNIKPVVINKHPFNRLESEHFELESEVILKNADSNGLQMPETEQTVVGGRVSADDCNSQIPKAHSISDSDEEEPSQSQSVADDDDDDDDDVIICNPRTRIPKPIVLSDDDEDDQTTNCKFQCK